MGTYLSTPVTEKNEESGESSTLAWGVVDMQGWRKTMEDAHVAVSASPPLSVDDDDPPGDHGLGVFGVFDGHGGPEVARFCQLYLVSVLKQQDAWKRHAAEASSLPPPPSSVPKEEEDQEEDPAREGEDPTTVGGRKHQHQPHPKETGVGRALVTAFHALDRMIDDPDRRDELILLRATKPKAGEQLVAATIPPLPPQSPAQPQRPPSLSLGQESRHEVGDPVEELEKGVGSGSLAVPVPANDGDLAGSEESDGLQGVAVATPLPSSHSEAQKGDDVGVQFGGRPEEGDKVGDVAPHAEEEDDDSTEAVGKEEAALEREHEDEDDEMEEVPVESSPAGSSKVSVMFQRLLNMSTPTGQIVVQLTGQQPGAARDPASSTGPAVMSPSASIPSLIRNGRLICNLPDHPIHAGATAIVAVITGRTLTVANAGDSRAVLCRHGGAYPLSFDHKPLQQRELSRIRNAGGFVNQFGRVNGNLNLSRSIGDLKYKQVPHVPFADQMITAEPDIVQVELGEFDEFIILGCDGIWDCLTNEKAVEYVRSRIDSMPPTQIGTEMLDEIISEDPRATQGIGGDNMTIMIIDLQPATRAWRRIKAAAAAAAAAEPESPFSPDVDTIV